ncbi:MAG TPA: hypothetical protein VEH84_03445, partial [Alphaproteobacteria bacterium]|nr:hypothetical protein [Alphaproteobacteria bacterium]
MDKLVRRGGKGRIGRWWTASLGVHLGLLALLGLLHIAPAADEPPLLEVVLTELSGAAGASGGRTGGGGETLGAPEAAEAAGSVTKPDAPSPVAAATEPAPTPPSPPVPTARPEPTPVATQTAALAEAPLPPPPKPAAPAKPKPTVAKA